MPEFLDLPAHDVHLWMCEIDLAADARRLDRYRAMLTPDEAAQNARFVFEKDRCRHLFTRALARTVLSRYAGGRRAPEDWRFEANAEGCPRVANPLPGMLPVVFNLTHTDDCVVMGIRARHAVGVDVEKWDRRINLDIAEHFFSAPEVAALQALPPDAQGERFMELWTFKESYIKARTLGLSIPLDGFGFRMDRAGDVSLWTDASRVADADPRRWQLWQVRPTARHVLAVCAERGEGGAPADLILYRVSPLDPEPPQRMDIAPVRRSLPVSTP